MRVDASASTIPLRLDAPEFLAEHFDLLIDGDKVGTIIEVGFQFRRKGLQEPGVVMER